MATGRRSEPQPVPNGGRIGVSTPQGKRAAMSIVLSCPDCSRKLKVPDELLGKKVKCPACGKVFKGETEAPSGPPPLEDEAPAPEERFEDEPPPHEEERPSRRSKRRAEVPPDEEEGYEEDRPSRRSRRGVKPGKVQAIAIMTLVGGIWALFWALVFGTPAGLSSMGLCCIPGIYGVVVGIMAIIKGSQLLGENAREQPAPTSIAGMMLINIINLDVPNLVMGIVCLVFLSDPEVKEFFRG